MIEEKIRDFLAALEDLKLRNMDYLILKKSEMSENGRDKLKNPNANQMKKFLLMVIFFTTFGCTSSSNEPINISLKFEG